VASAQLVERLVSAGLAGLEFSAGLPGSVGGAVAGNAGCFGATFGERLLRATIVDLHGEAQTIEDPSWFGFDYRRSRLQDGIAILVDVTLEIAPGDAEALRKIADGHLETRRTKHPARDVKTAGSYFKNLPPAADGQWRQPAGALLDQVGARGMSVGDAAVFEKHANILINRGNASARDVLMLEALLTQRVHEKFGVTLEPEVRFAGRRPVL
jgi:UDP-N-acetylmuramate dehydrogenase